ncbi:hypothetical protein B296_00020788, partial [Ensete ventricosum]
PLDRYRSTRATVSRKARNGAKQPLTPTRRHRRLPLLKRSRICYDIHGGRKQSPAAVGAVKERLHALRKLIPRKTDSVKEKETATDRIFEETAEYILLLRAQVEVLKLLVDFHSPSSCMEKNGGMQ